MNNIWYKQLGFHNNPFSIKPAAFHDTLFGYENLVSQVIQAVGNNELLYIEGQYGEGKTTMLKHIVRHFGGHKKVVYFSVNRVESRLQIRKLLNERYGRLGVWFDIRPKNMILLLDEASEINANDVEKLLKFKKDGNFRSIVFVSQQYNPETMPDEVKKSLKMFRMEKLNDDNAISLVRKRVGELPLLTDDTIRKIFAISNRNARDLLKNCETVCKKAADSGLNKIGDKVLTNLFGESSVIQEEPEEEKIFLQIDEDSLPEEGQELKENDESILNEPEEDELEEEKPKEEMEKDWEDVSVEDDELKKERKELEEETEIDEELSKISLEEEDDSEKKAKISNGNSKKALAMEEALGKSTDDLIDEHYY